MAGVGKRGKRECGSKQDWMVVASCERLIDSGDDRMSAASDRDAI